MSDLREFADWEDLINHAEWSDIVKWVNGYAKLVEQRDAYGKKYRRKRAMLLKLAEEILDKDELESINQQAKRQAASEAGY